MITGVWNGIIFSARILVRSFTLLLVGALVPNDAGRGWTRASRGMAKKNYLELWICWVIDGDNDSAYHRLGG